MWKCFFSYFDVANELRQSMSEYDAFNEPPFRGLPLIGSLPVVLLSILSSMDSYVKNLIGDWPYVRLNYELIFPIFGATSIDEEPYLELYDFLKKTQSKSIGYGFITIQGFILYALVSCICIWNKSSFRNFSNLLALVFTGFHGFHVIREDMFHN